MRQEKRLDHRSRQGPCRRSYWNFGGMPAMSVPVHWSDAGLPIGSHFMASQFEEETLLSPAGQLEGANPWRNKLAPVGR